MGEKVTEGVGALLDAITLEVIYRLVCAKGFSGDRRRFLIIGRKIVAEMQEHGELPLQ